MITEACTSVVQQLAGEEQAKLGTRVLVMRRWPRGLSRHDVDVWLPDAGPSLDLLQRYRAKEIDWSQFEQEYRREQCEQKTCRVVWYSDGERTSDETVAFSPLKTLYKWSLTRDIAVLCWENHTQCHRYILLAMLKSYSVKPDNHGFWSPYLNGKVLRKEGTGVFRNPPVLCNSEEEAWCYTQEHARLGLQHDEEVPNWKG